MATNEHIIKAPGMMKNLAVGGHLTTADQVLDDAMNKEQSQINAETATAISNEVSRAEAAEELLRQAYEALTQSDIVVGDLPASGEVATIYRVPGESSYKDYMWDGTQFVEMAEYDNAIDDEPTVESDNLVKSGGVFDYVQKPLFSTRGNTFGRIKELYLKNLDPSKTYTVGALRREDSEIILQINVLVGDSYSSVAGATYSNSMNGMLVYISERNSSGITGYGVFNLDDDATTAFSPSPMIVYDTVTNLAYSPTIKKYINAGIDSVIPLASVHESSSERPALEYGDYFVEGASLYCNINITNSLYGARLVTYNGKVFYRDTLSYDDSTKQNLHELPIQDSIAFQNLLLNSAAGINGTEIEVTVPDVSLLDDGYYDTLGILHTDSSNWGFLSIPITQGKKYFLRMVMSDSVGVVALGTNGSVIEVLKTRTLYTYNTGYPCICCSYVNTNASYLVVSIYKNYINVARGSLKLYESEYVKDYDLLDRATQYGALGDAAHEVITEFPNAFSDLDAGFYYRNARYGEHENFRHYKVPISVNKKYYIECYIRNNLGVVSLDESGNVVDALNITLTETSGNYSLGKAVYVNTNASYLAFSVQNLAYEVYSTKLRVVEADVPDDYSSYNRTSISIGSVLARAYDEPIKVAFFGDSTYDGNTTTGYVGHEQWDEEHGGLGVVEYVNEKAFPYLLQQKLRTSFGTNNFTCYNVGYSGKYASWGFDNFDAVFGGAYADADIIVVGFGINDRIHYNNSLNAVRQYYRTSMLAIIAKIHELGKTPVLMTSQAGWQFGIKSTHVGTSYDKMTFSYIPACVCDEVKRDIAREENIELIDLNTFDYNLLLSDVYNPTQICSDALHFGDLGHDLESSFLAKVFNPRTQEVGKEQRITFINEMVKSDFIIDVDFANDSQWYKKLSITAASTDLSKEVINICIFMKESCTMTAIGTNVSVTINGMASTTEVSLDAFKYYNVVVYPAATGAVEFKGFEFA